MPLPLNENLKKVKVVLYDVLDLHISNLINEPEGKEYDACQFDLNGRNVICRSSKITPKKVGQFVTFWQRNSDGITEPFNATDAIDFYVINVKTKEHFGQFVFPKEELVKRGIMTTVAKDGKRGFRIYPSWDVPMNKQATKTQNWQLNYFFEVGPELDVELVRGLYRLK